MSLLDLDDWCVDMETERADDPDHNPLVKLGQWIHDEMRMRDRHASSGTCAG
jgi:hypothetical protein